MVDRGSQLATARRREQARLRSEAYRERQFHGRLLVSLEVSRTQIAALERLALLDVGERDRDCIAWAVGRFLDAAPHLSALGDALWPQSEGDQGDCDASPKVR